MKKVTAEAIFALNSVQSELVWVGDDHTIIDDLSLLYQVCVSRPKGLSLILETPIPADYKSMALATLQKEPARYKDCKDKAYFVKNSVLRSCLRPSKERMDFLDEKDGKSASPDVVLGKVIDEIINAVYADGGQATLIGGRPSSDDDKDDDVKTNDPPQDKKLPVAHSEYGSDLDKARKSGGENKVVFSGIRI